MKFNKTLIVLLLILLASIFIVVDGGSNNSPYQKQKDYDYVSLTDDPISQFNPFIFDFEFPSIDIPIIGGTFGLGETGVWIIIIIFLLMVSILGISMIITQRRKKNQMEEKITESVKAETKELEIRRQTLGKRIEEIIRFLNECLDGRFNQGITEGFERLDAALKEYSKISRPGWLTPREFSLLKIPYFNHEAMITVVEQFYLITYGQKPASRKDLEEFIECFKLMIVDEQVLKWKSDSKGG
ncbi:MAG: hypothetical protein ACFFB2_03475 [Promethearchaeota archaeon]